MQGQRNEMRPHALKHILCNLFFLESWRHEVSLGLKCRILGIPRHFKSVPWAKKSCISVCDHPRTSNRSHHYGELELVQMPPYPHFFNMHFLFSIFWFAVVAELTSLEAQPGSAPVPGKELSCHAHHPIITSLFPNSHNPLLKAAWLCCYGEVLFLLWGRFQPRYRP